MTHFATAFRAMGCQVNVWLETDQDGAALLLPIQEWVNEMEDHLSRFRPESELTRLNQKAGEWVVVSSLLFTNIMAALKAAEITDGLFNPLILPTLKAAGYRESFDPAIQPITEASVAVMDWYEIEVDATELRIKLPAHSELDLGGVAKGWISQTLANRLAQHGVCLFDAGGDLVGRGSPLWSEGWRVGVAEPNATHDQMLLYVNVQDSAIATSGIDYRRWGDQHHIIDPRTGQPAQTDALSVTVIHPQATYAEAYAKAILILGAEAGLTWFNQKLTQENAHTYSAALVFARDGNVFSTSNFQQFIV